MTEQGYDLIKDLVDQLAGEASSSQAIYDLGMCLLTIQECIAEGLDKRIVLKAISNCAALLDDQCQRWVSEIQIWN